MRDVTDRAIDHYAADGMAWMVYSRVAVTIIAASYVSAKLGKTTLQNSDNRSITNPSDLIVV